jgi:predicted HicB family RNase H-like nuclease
MDNKKSTYNAEAQKKYNQKFKNIACKVSIEEYNKIKQHAESKGFKSLNAYVINLIDKDINNN